LNFGCEAKVSACCTNREQSRLSGLGESMLGKGLGAFMAEAEIIRLHIARSTPQTGGDRLM
jgi:hypothetical protein